MDDLASSVAASHATPFTEWHALREEMPGSVDLDAAVAAVVTTWTTTERQVQSHQALTDAAAGLFSAVTYVPNGPNRVAELMRFAEWLLAVARQLVLGERSRVVATARSSTSESRAGGVAPPRIGPSSAAAALGSRSISGGSR